MMIFVKSNILLPFILCFLIKIWIISHKNTQIIVLLGSNNPQIQNQRVKTVLNYIDLTTEPVILYLSGGSKSGDTESESTIMQRKINKFYPHIQTYTDTISTNTAENFTNLNEWMEFNKTENDKVVIVTSDFHKERAEKIFNGIITDIIPEWNLSTSNCNWCWDEELIHMKNVNNDIVKALHIHNM